MLQTVTMLQITLLIVLHTEDSHEWVRDINMREIYRTILTLKINIDIASTDFSRVVYINLYF